MEHLTKEHLAPQLKFYSLSFCRKYRIGHPREEISDVEPTILLDPVFNVIGDAPLVVFEPHTAIFRFDNGEAVLLHWPIPKEHDVSQEQFVQFCHDQVRYLQVQLYCGGSKARVSCFDISSRRLISCNDKVETSNAPCWDATSEYVYNTNRYTCPITIFEAVLTGATVGSYGMIIK